MRLRATARFYLPPGTKGRFIAAFDPSEGVEGGNPLGGVVLRAENWEVAAVLTGLLAPHRFAAAIAILAGLYSKGDVSGKPLVAVEANTFGIAVLQELRQSKLSLYGTFIVSRGDYKIGFPTHRVSRDNAFEQMRLAGDKWGIIVHDRELWEQIRPGSLIYDEDERARVPDGPDDLAISLAIACAVRAEKYGLHPMALPDEAVKPAEKLDRFSWVWKEEEERVKALQAETEEPEWIAYA